MQEDIELATFRHQSEVEEHTMTILRLYMAIGETYFVNLVFMLIVVCFVCVREHCERRARNARDDENNTYLQKRFLCLPISVGETSATSLL